MENATNSIYLAYGSNMNLEQMAWRCPYATVVGPVKIPGYRLLFRGSRNNAVATIEPDAGSSDQAGLAVPALLWEITPRCEEALDRYEGWPRFYRKERITVTFGDRETDAMVYIMNKGHCLGAPASGYLNAIRAGYDSAGFDTAFLDAAVEESERLATQEDERWLEEGREIEEGTRQFKWW